MANCQIFRIFAQIYAKRLRQSDGVFSLMTIPNHMSGKPKFNKANMLKAACTTLMAFGLSLIMMQPFSLSIATLISSNDRNDFNITDFYNIVADGRDVRSVDRDIVILDITGADREDLAFVLDALPVFEPRAVGLDVMFDEPHYDDSLLLAAIAKLPAMVMVVDVKGEKNHGAEKFIVSDKSFFVNDINKDGYFGASNLPTRFEGGVVREFAVDYPLVGGGSIASFPVAIAERVDSVAVAKLRSRGLHLENINYPSRTFRHVFWQNLGDNPDALRDKVVLIGALDNPGDRHATPPQHQMSGIEIHAHSLATILNGTYIDSLGSFSNLAIAFTLCFAMALVHVCMPPEFKALALRFIQVLLLYFIIRIGYYFFIEHSLIINFSYTLLMMTFVLFACDIWFGAYGTVKYYKKYKSRRAQKKQPTNQ